MGFTQTMGITKSLAFQYECGASTVRNNAVCSMLSTGEVLAPTEGALLDWLGPIPVVLGIDPNDNFGSLLGQVGGMPLFGWLDLHSRINVSMGRDGELSSGAGKLSP